MTPATPDTFELNYRHAGLVLSAIDGCLSTGVFDDSAEDFADIEILQHDLMTWLKREAVRQIQRDSVGCYPVEDVCMTHERPLTCEHGCDEANEHECRNAAEGADDE